MEKVRPKSVVVKDMPGRKLACVRHVGPFAGDRLLFERLFGSVFAWAVPRGLFKPPQSEMITVFHDDPARVAADKLRISVGLTVPPGTALKMPPDGEIGLLEIPAGKYLCAQFEISINEYSAAWKTVFAECLPQAGWQLGDGLCYECCLGDPNEHPEGKHRTEICVSVKPL